MKDQVKNMFAEITMPEETTQQIRRAMAQKKAAPAARPHRRPAAVAAMLLSVLLLAGLGLNTQVRAAVENLVKRYVFHNGTTVIEKREDGISGIIFSPNNIADCLEVRDGRLYLIANGENRDITDETSLEKPYFYTYVDSQAVEHLLILGGTPDNYGYHEFYREDSGQGDWLGGEGANYLDMKTGKVYPWLVNAWEELNIPWPLPGDNG